MPERFKDQNLKYQIYDWFSSLTIDHVYRWRNRNRRKMKRPLYDGITSAYEKIRKAKNVSVREIFKKVEPLTIVHSQVLSTSVPRRYFYSLCFCGRVPDFNRLKSLQNSQHFKIPI